MKPTFRSLALSLFVCLFLGVVAWAYLGSFITVFGGGDPHLSYPGPPIGPYPSQYMPMVVDLPAPTPISPPTPKPAFLHPGLSLRWDGEGDLYLDGYYFNPGTHDRCDVDQQLDADTVRVRTHFWYDPDPFDWGGNEWYCHYNTNTQRVESCSASSDPIWKWGYPWVFPSDVVLVNGGTVQIDGQIFNVSGPHTFLSGFGEQVNFWRMVNRDRFLIFHSGEWKQYVDAGNAVLFYEYAPSRLLLFDNVKRSYYRNNQSTGDSVRYHSYLTRYEGLVVAAGELAETQAADPSAATGAPEDVALNELLDSLGLSSGSVGAGPSGLPHVTP